MATEEIAATSAIAAAAYVAQKLFGKTLDEMGDDLNKAYRANREKILARAARKVINQDDGATPNLRVARDVIWNGAVTDNEVCAEYFGGLLASSRSADGTDDSALVYVDCIKALSSKQLHLHYIIYCALQELLFQAGQPVNPGLDREINSQEVCFPLLSLNALGLRPDVDLNVLHRQGLIQAYATNVRINGGKSLPYATARPTTFGVLLFAAAMNALPEWKQYGRSKFSVSSDIPMPPVFTRTLDELALATGLDQIPSPPPATNAP